LALKCTRPDKPRCDQLQQVRSPTLGGAIPPGTATSRNLEPEHDLAGNRLIYRVNQQSWVWNARTSGISRDAVVARAFVVKGW
jgi:hypothetical protein